MHRCGLLMAPSPSPRFLLAFLRISRLGRAAPKSPFCPIIVPFHQPRHRATPWQLLLRDFSAGRGGRDGDSGEPLDPLGKAPLAGGVNREDSESQFERGSDDDDGARDRSPIPRNGAGDSEEPRLFGEGGLFGSGRRSSDDWDEQQEEMAESPPWSTLRTDFTPEGGHMETEYGAGEGEKVEDGQGPAYTHPMGADYAPGQPATGGEQGWGLGVEGAEPIREGDKYYDPDAQALGGEDQPTWFQREDTGRRAPEYAGEWGPDGRFLKAVPRPLDEDGGDTYPPALEDPAFGELIKRSGFTDDDIANLMAGFYEPVGLPHLDDYKFVDMEAERKKKRRELELAKMAEMAKRWVRKIDDQGFAHGVGRRKRSRARVWIREGEGRIIINRKHHDMYFTFIHNRVEYLEPFVITDTLGMFDTFVLVKGGGVSGQSSAIRHGLSRALMWYEPSLRAPLKKAGMLRRDDREVERKKPGKAKARKSFQWVKR